MWHIAHDTRRSVWNTKRGAAAGDLLTLLGQVLQEIGVRGIESRLIYSRGALLRSPR